MYIYLISKYVPYWMHLNSHGRYLLVMTLEMLCQVTTSGNVWEARAAALSNGYTLSLVINFTT